jgi:hypothetical protein
MRGGTPHSWPALAILAAGIAGLAAAQPAPAPPAVPPAVAAPVAPVGTITGTQLRALMKIALAASVETEISDATSVGLGLSEPGQPYLTRQIAFRTQDGARHILAVHPSGQGPALFLQSVGGNGSIWVCDPDAKLIKAASITEALIQILDIKDAREGFDKEMDVWSKYVPPSAGSEGADERSAIRS